jgi:RNA polymerase sigma-70 factor (ECF subfamily)
MLRTTLHMPPADARAAIVEALVQEHQAGVRAFIRAIGVQEAWVDDVAQETFLVAYRKLHEWDRGRDAGQWLRGIARRLAANERRKGTRRTRLIGGGLAARLIEHSESDGASAVAELLEAMHACLQELPESGRDLLRRRYADGERTEIIAANMEIRADSLRQKLHRLRLLVKGCVERKVRGTWA